MALARQRKTLVAVVAVVLMMLVVACPVSQVLALTAYDIALRPLFAPRDRSDDVKQLIIDEFDGRVTDLSVRRVDDLKSWTDFPFAYEQRRWGYRASYRVVGSPIVLHLATFGPTDLADPLMYKEVFPSSIGLSCDEFVAVLGAYAQSGESDLSGAATLETLGRAQGAGSITSNGVEYPPTECVVLGYSADGSGIIESGGAGGHLVHLDRETLRATYLGPVDDLLSY